MGYSENRLGLTVGGDSVPRLGGTPFYGMGVNYYSGFNFHYASPKERYYVDGFALLKKYNIPYVRMAFCDWGPEYYSIYEQDKETVLSRLDEVVREAERQRIGIIASILWNLMSIPSYLGGEKLAAMGAPDSRITRYAKDYAAEIVKRYRGSPAIWGWEIGNEYNLAMDRFDPALKEYAWEHSERFPRPHPDGFDYLTSTELREFYKEIAGVIREYDPCRMISNGNGDMRFWAKSMRRAMLKMDRKTHSWVQDTSPDSLQDFYEMNAYMAPDPVDTISFHWQLATLVDVLDDPPPRYKLHYDVWGRSGVSAAEILKEYARAAKRAKKAAFFGEFGDFMDMEQIHDKQVIPHFKTLVGWIEAADIPISCSWQFMLDSPKTHVVSDNGIEGEKLKILSAQNLKYKAEGKQDVESYWSL